jgi:hypothetical protein
MHAERCKVARDRCAQTTRRSRHERPHAGEICFSLSQRISVANAMWIVNTGARTIDRCGLHLQAWDLPEARWVWSSRSKTSLG